MGYGKMPVSCRTTGGVTYYYIAVHDAGRTALLAGPYEVEPDEPLRDMVRRMANDACAWAWFYTFSLAKSSVLFKTRFGAVRFGAVEAADVPPPPRKLRS